MNKDRNMYSKEESILKHVLIARSFSADERAILDAEMSDLLAPFGMKSRDAGRVVGGLTGKMRNDSTCDLYPEIWLSIDETTGTRISGVILVSKLVEDDEPF